VSLTLGITKLIQEVGYTTLLPSIIAREGLIKGNSRLLLANSMISSVAPTLGAALVKLLSPALALVGSTGTSLIACSALLRLPRSHGHPQVTRKRHFLQEIGEGMRTLFASRLLRPMTISSCAGAFAVGIQAALLIVLLSRGLALPTLMVGLIVSANAMAMAVGSLISPWVSNSFGVGRSVILGNSITAFAYGTLAIAAFVQSAELSVLALVMSGFGTSFYIVNQTSIRQSVTPPALMARVHASRRFVVFSFLPLGSLTGGLVADEYSLAASLSIACLFMTIAALITLFSPLRHRSLQLTTETGAS
jgi:hypothetical protein